MLDRRVAHATFFESLPFCLSRPVLALCFVTMFLFLTQIPSAAALSAVFPTKLRCEYLKDPIGLDVPKPRLSWTTVLPADTQFAQNQTAYQVLVSTTREHLEANRGDLWDSGWVKSSGSQQIEYEGKALRSGQACWWKVRVRLSRGGETAWSSPARWSMGILKPQEWTAKWIGTDMVFERRPGLQDNSLPDPWLRKTFTLQTAPHRAMLHVASVGYHEVYVNGRRAGESLLAPCVTDHTRRARYVTYDISDLLQPGKNALVIWLGFSWSIFPPYQTSDKPASPIVLAQADLEWADGKTLRVATDETWKWHPSPNTTIGLWDFMNFGGERYDANKEIKGWAEADLDDSSWTPVKTFSPALQVSAQRVEPNRKIEEINPVAIEEVRPDVWRVDMGMNFTGYLEADVAGDPGDVVEFKWSEMKDKDMTHKLHSFYVIGPGGRGTFRNRFNYGVGRWIQIHGLKKRPDLNQVRGWFIRTGYERAAEFRCSNPLLNRIFETTLWTYENLSLGGYVVDCAQRERMGYGGDAHATTAMGMDVFKTAALYYKWAEDWRDVQGKSAAWGVGKKTGELGSGKAVEAGNLPYTAPTYWGGGGPAWSGYCVTLPWEMYSRYGDTRILEQMFPTIEAWLGFVETKVKHDLLRRYGGEWDFLGDWLWPGAQGVNGDTRETLFFNNCYWVYNLDTASRIATVLGRKDQARKWNHRAGVVRSAIHKEFYDAAKQTYVDGSQACLAIALLTGVPPAADSAVDRKTAGGGNPRASPGSLVGGNRRRRDADEMAHPGQPAGPGLHHGHQGGIPGLGPHAERGRHHHLGRLGGQTLPIPQQLPLHRRLVHRGPRWYPTRNGGEWLREFSDCSGRLERNAPGMGNLPVRFSLRHHRKQLETGIRQHDLHDRSAAQHHRHRLDSGQQSRGHHRWRQTRCPRQRHPRRWQPVRPHPAEPPTRNLSPRGTGLTSAHQGRVTP